MLDGQQLMQRARVIKTEDEITLLNTACMMADAAYDELYRATEAGHERERVRRARLEGAVRPRLGARRGRQRDLGRALQPAPARLRRSDPATGRSGVLRHPARLPRLPHVLLPHLRGRQRLERAGRRVQALPPLPRCGHLADPARNDDRRGRRRCGRGPRSSASPNEEAAFALQYGHGIGLSIWEKPIFSRLVSLEHPEVIEEGMVFALETFWPASDGWSAARIEEELVVTATGCEIMTRFPAEELLVAGHALPRGRRPAPRDPRDAVEPQRRAPTAQRRCRRATTRRRPR